MPYSPAESKGGHHASGAAGKFVGGNSVHGGGKDRLRSEKEFETQKAEAAAFRRDKGGAHARVAGAVATGRDGSKETAEPHHQRRGKLMGDSKTNISGSATSGAAERKRQDTQLKYDKIAAGQSRIAAAQAMRKAPSPPRSEPSAQEDFESKRLENYKKLLERTRRNKEAEEFANEAITQEAMRAARAEQQEATECERAQTETSPAGRSSQSGGTACRRARARPT